MINILPLKSVAAGLQQAEEFPRTKLRFAAKTEI